MMFEVNRSDLAQTRSIEVEARALTPGQARLRVRKFGLSANNVTYAVFGDAMGYWSFFPADEGWGRVPVWGFADVVEANGTGLVEGESVYGYLPMGDELIVEPTRVAEHGFTDGSTHRAALPPAYNGFTRCSTDPVYASDTEALQMLFRPLFMTDFVLDDWLADSSWFGADEVVLSSASSKTAFGLAHLIAARAEAGGQRPTVVGLTSAGNRDFVDQLGFYDQIVTYDELSAADSMFAGDRPTVYVDMAGDGAVRHAVHTQRPGLTASVQVGGTHWGDLNGPSDLPGPAPALFFAPDQIVKRRDDWGPGGVEERFAIAWESFLPIIDPLVEVVEATGTDEIAQVWKSVLDGTAPPHHGYVLAP